MKKEKIMQITIKPGVHIVIGVNNVEEFKEIKTAILSSKTEFVDVLDTCTLKRNDIVAIEYFEKEVIVDEKSDN
jgi:hypothetical protein|nr:MAG TPA: hypothetical protein [Caudoviricetes sp.]